MVVTYGYSQLLDFELFKKILLLNIEYSVLILIDILLRFGAELRRGLKGVITSDPILKGPRKGLITSGPISERKIRFEKTERWT